MQRATIDLWVGVFVVAGIAALLFLALRVGGMGAFERAETYQIKASFSNIGGLKVRAPVKSAGVVIGRVSEISFDPELYEASVTLRLDARYRFPLDTTAAIMTSGLLGEQYIALDAGGDDKMLAAGDSLRLTQGAVVLENLIGQFLYGQSGSGSGDTNSAPAP